MGVPLIVIVFADHTAKTPVGKPVAVPIPVAPVVVCVTVDIIVFIHVDGVDEGAETVFSETTVIVPVAFTDPHPPVSGMA
jgi:heme/copper-type cytochrome/quinol oxidase subunit 4